MLNRAQAKFLLTQMLIQAGVVAILTLGAFAIAGCSSKSTEPAQTAAETSPQKIKFEYQR